MRIVESHPDGSALVEIRCGKVRMLVWEIVATVRRGGRGKGTIVRLLTNLVDFKKHPAQELLTLYAQRWEQEIFYKELKVDMRSSARLQSHTVLTAVQEVAALILGLRGTGRLQGGGGSPERCGGAAHQFHQDPSGGSGVVAVSRCLLRHPEPKADRPRDQAIHAADCPEGHTKTQKSILPPQTATTCERLAQVTQKHLPQRPC